MHILAREYAGTPMPMDKYDGAIDKNYNYKCACAYDCVWDECEHIGYMRDGFKIYSHCRKGCWLFKKLLSIN